MRGALAILLTAGLGVAGCKKAAPTPPPDAGVEAPELVLAPVPAGEVHRYQLQEVVTVSLDEAPAAGHVLRLDYRLEGREARPDRIEVTVHVDRITLEAQRAGYKTSLDSTRQQDLKRVANGVDTEIFFDGVRWFALLQAELPITLTRRGHLHALDGGEKLRHVLLAMFPPAPRRALRTKGMVEVAMDDARIVGLLLPAANLMPRKGDVKVGRRLDVDERSDEVDYVADVARATLLQGLDGGFLRLRTKRLDHLSQTKSAVPAPQSGPHFTLVDGKHESNIQLDTRTPAFSEGGSSDVRRLKYDGLVDGKDGTHSMLVERTRVWKRMPSNPVRTP